MKIKSIFLIFFIQIAVSLGSDLKDSTVVLNYLSDSKISLDKDPEKSYQLAQNALQLSQKIGFKKGESESYRRTGIFYMFKSEYPKALENILKGLRIAEKIDDKLLISKSLMNLGGIYYDNDDYNLSLSYFSKSIKIAQAINDKQIISGCLTNTANVYTNMGNYKLALENYQSALKINVDLQDKSGISITLSNIGNVYFYQQNYKAAENYYLKCLKIKNELNDYQGKIICLNNIGKLYLRTDQNEKAITYCTQSLDLAREINSMDDIQLASFALSSAFKKKGDFKTALAYFELGSSVKDSIFNETKNKELGKLESKYELEKQESQINLLKKDRALKEEKSQRQLVNRNLLIGGILLISILILSIVQFRNNRHTKKINAQLVLQNKEIEAKSEALSIANEELDNFIYRSSHDLKAPLTSVLGLISITQYEVTEKTLLEYLIRMKLSVDQLMLVLQDLSNYSRNARMKIEIEKINFSDLLEKTIEGLKHLDKFAKIKIDLKLDTDIEFYSDVTRIGILINSLLSNAITHNDLSNSNPLIKIEIKVDSKQCLITVNDNGKEIDQEIRPKIFEMFFKGSNESKGSGLGLYIAKGVVKKLEGMLEFTSTNALGTTFIANIPNSFQQRINP